jgi:hypothetical protein
MPVREITKAAQDTAPMMGLTRPRLARLEAFLDALPDPGSRTKK